MRGKKGQNDVDGIEQDKFVIILHLKNEDAFHSCWNNFHIYFIISLSILISNKISAIIGYFSCFKTENMCEIVKEI